MTPATSAPVTGYLLLADISGYTDFVTSTELEHSHKVIAELTGLIRATLVPPFDFVKLEGDAVFCHVSADGINDADHLLDLVKATYRQFSKRVLGMISAYTCTCRACRSIGDLDLKFVGHFGAYIVDREPDGRIDLAGPSVILAHRLLKNTVIENGGPEGYAFITDQCFGEHGLDKRQDHHQHELDKTAHTETYERFGEVSGVVHDLTPLAAHYER